MPSGLEIYDDKGRLIVTTENIIPRFLGTHTIPLQKSGSITIPELSYGGNVTARFFLRVWFKIASGYRAMLSNEFTTFSVNNDVFTYHVDYDEYRWESGGDKAILKIENFVTIWVI